MIKEPQLYLTNPTKYVDCLVRAHSSVIFIPVCDLHFMSLIIYYINYFFTSPLYFYIVIYSINQALPVLDSVLQIVNTDFKINDDFDELPAGEIRQNAAEELSQEYRGKPMSRKVFSQRNWILDKENKNEEERHFSDGIGSNDECDEMVNFSEKSDEDGSNMSDYDQSGSQESRESDEELPSDRFKTF